MGSCFLPPELVGRGRAAQMCMTGDRVDAQEAYRIDPGLLERLIEEARCRAGRDARHLREMKEELARAVVVNSREIPPDVITMNSRVVPKDLDSGDVLTLTLTFPSDADAEKDMVSVLTPIGTAISGFRKGDVIEWEVPAGMRRLRVQKLLYQPESAGDHDL